MSFDRFKVDKPTALMSRLDEIIKSEMSESAALRTLAAEVDARDAVITKLLAMLKPPIIAHGPNDEWGAYCESCWWAGSARDAKWTGIDSEYDGSCPICGKGIEEYTGDERTAAIYRRACEIAGRAE